MVGIRLRRRRPRGRTEPDAAPSFADLSDRTPRHLYTGQDEARRPVEGSIAHTGQGRHREPDPPDPDDIGTGEFSRNVPQ